jgi:hypothetical protein
MMKNADPKKLRGSRINGLRGAGREVYTSADTDTDQQPESIWRLSASRVGTRMLGRVCRTVGQLPPTGK